MEAWLRNWVDRLGPPRPSARSDRAARRDPPRGPERPRRSSNADRRRRERGGPPPYAARRASPSPSARAARSGSASSARSGSSSTTTARAVPSSTTRCSRPAAPRAPSPSGWAPSTPSGWRRVTSTSDRTRCRTTIRRSSAWSGPSRWTKPAFVGKAALERMRALPLERTLVGLRIEGEPRARGPAPADDRVVGRVTSSVRSEAAGGTIALGWIRAVDGSFPTRALRRRVIRRRRADTLLRPRGGPAPCVSSPATLIGVVTASAEAGALDMLLVPGRAFACRAADDELLLLCAPPVTDEVAREVATRLAALDPDAPRDRHDRRMGGDLGGRGRCAGELRSPVRLELPEAGFLQGEVVHVPAKVVAGDGRLLILVPSIWEGHLHDRARKALGHTGPLESRPWAVPTS